MTKFDGVVILADEDIPVDVELLDGRVRLLSSGNEIGDWEAMEVVIAPDEGTGFTIEAENETLHFFPAEPALFAAALGETPGASGNGVASAAGHLSGAAVQEADSSPEPVNGEAPPPRPVTLALFYGLSALTAGLAVWALISIIF